jgi:hypothetical protein
MESYAAGVFGGILIGIAAALLYFTLGRIAGVSGILGGLVGWTGWRWRLPFVAGLLVAGALFQLAGTTVFAPLPRSAAAIAAAGLLVGFGTRMAGGCTSGHGVCGVSRLSRRALAATATFTAAGAIMVFLVRVVFGGAL